MMHEQSLLASLLKQVDQIRQENGADRITEVRVEIGPLAGVEPLLLASAFEQLAPAAIGDASLVIDTVPLTARCQSCHRSLEIHDYCFRCPDCSGNVRVTRGDELRLISVSLISDEPLPKACR